MFYLKNQYLILFNDTASIRKGSHDGIVFKEFDRNPNFENYSPCRMNLYKVLFIS